MQQPRVSVIVPTYARPTQIQTCVKSLCDANYPKDLWELVVVDDGSAEPVSDCLQGFNTQLNLTCLRQTNKGPGAARNFGAQNATGEILVFTDDDCVPEVDWLPRLVDAVSQDDTVLAGGKTLNGISDNPYSEASQLMIDFLDDYFSRQHTSMRFFTSNNMACRALDFRALGGFDEEFGTGAGEDRDFARRWIQSGRMLTDAPSAIIKHMHRLDFASFVRHHFDYGAGACRFRLVSSKQAENPNQLQSPSFYLRLIAYPMSINKPNRFTLCLLMLVMQIATIFGFISELIMSSPFFAVIKSK